MTRGVASYIEMTGNPVCVKHAEYLCVTFGKRVTLKIYIEMIKANAFRTYALQAALYSEVSDQAMTLTLCKAVIWSAVTYANSAREFAADSLLLKLRRLKSDVRRTVSNFLRRTANRDLRVDFKIPNLCQLVIQLCRQQAEVLRNHGNENVRLIGQGDRPTRETEDAQTLRSSS